MLSRLLFFLGCAICSQSQATDGSLNILLLDADDWRHDALGVAGNPVVKTPVIDKLASESIRFTHNYVTTSICGVSRSSLYTGQWMSRHGNENFRSFKTPWEHAFPGLLRENGYYLGRVGKWHSGAFPAEKFDFGRSYHGVHWIKKKGERQVHVTQKNEADALDFLAERPRDRPFCLTVSFFAPHSEDTHPLQFLPQPKSLALYEDVTIPVAANASDESWNRLPAYVKWLKALSQPWTSHPFA